MSDYNKAIWKPSPNFDKGRQWDKGWFTPSYIVLHGTGGGGTVEWFQNPVSGVSAHYLVEEDGTVYQFVLEDDVAWHAGEVPSNSPFYLAPNPNLYTIGIEHSRNMKNDSPITDLQLAASLELCKDIIARHGQLKFLTHDLIEPGRICPGPNFPLSSFLSLYTESSLFPTPDIVNTKDSH